MARDYGLTGSPSALQTAMDEIRKSQEMSLRKSQGQREQDRLRMEAEKMGDIFGQPNFDDTGFTGFSDREGEKEKNLTRNLQKDFGSFWGIKDNPLYAKAQQQLQDIKKQENERKAIADVTEKRNQELAKTQDLRDQYSRGLGDVRMPLEPIVKDQKMQVVPEDLKQAEMKADIEKRLAELEGKPENTVGYPSITKLSPEQAAAKRISLSQSESLGYPRDWIQKGNEWIPQKTSQLFSDGAAITGAPMESIKDMPKEQLQQIQPTEVGDIPWRMKNKIAEYATTARAKDSDPMVSLASFPEATQRLLTDDVQPTTEESSKLLPASVWAKLIEQAMVSKGAGGFRPGFLAALEQVISGKITSEEFEATYPKMNKIEAAYYARQFPKARDINVDPALQAWGTSVIRSGKIADLPPGAMTNANKSFINNVYKQLDQRRKDSSLNLAWSRFADSQTKPSEAQVKKYGDVIANDAAIKDLVSVYDSSKINLNRVMEFAKGLEINGMTEADIFNAIAGSNLGIKEREFIKQIASLDMTKLNQVAGTTFTSKLEDYIKGIGVDVSSDKAFRMSVNRLTNENRNVITGIKAGMDFKQSRNIPDLSLPYPSIQRANPQAPAQTPAQTPSKSHAPPEYGANNSAEINEAIQVVNKDGNKSIRDQIIAVRAKRLNIEPKKLKELADKALGGGK